MVLNHGRESHAVLEASIEILDRVLLLEDLAECQQDVDVAVLAFLLANEAWKSATVTVTARVPQCRDDGVSESESRSLATLSEGRWIGTSIWSQGFDLVSKDDGPQEIERLVKVAINQV